MNKYVLFYRYRNTRNIEKVIDDSYVAIQRVVDHINKLGNVDILHICKLLPNGKYVKFEDWKNRFIAPLYLDVKLPVDIKCKINNDHIILELFDILCDFTEYSNALNIIKKVLNYKFGCVIESRKLSDHDTDLLIKIANVISSEENPHYDSLLRFIYDLTNIVEGVYRDE